MINAKYKGIFDLFKELYYNEYGVKPEINIAQCSKLLDDRLKNHSEATICRIIKLFFANEEGEKVFHLPAILSSYIFNKYLPKVKGDDVEVPDYAKEWQQ